ncbi:hypothetical protein KTH73_04005 [Acinetobacter courvalinii]|uniref:hypothetical protein n=1 Tax=Acinetobacter courvalinii TaxID=280147 RepID=UPI0021CD5446|nr:hypothetical protein [Acinetobacter courvalinii]MCU4389891.1 hypothetical protein [Acinetobacter courvalinii]
MEEIQGKILSDIIYKTTIKTGSRICGYYKFKDVFQFLESDTPSNLTNKFMDIEFNNKYCNPEIYLEKNTSDIAKLRRNKNSHINFLNEIVALITLSTNQPCNLIIDEHEIFPSNFMKSDTFTDNSTKFEIRKVPNRISFRQNSTMSFIEIQDTAFSYFENYFKLDNNARKAYSTSIVLFNKMRQIMLISSSMSVVGFISCIENLIAFEDSKSKNKPEKCKTCNALLYSIAKKFKAFMEKYSEFDTENTNKLLNEFYSRRSTITHTGNLFYMDRVLTDFPMLEYRKEFLEIESHVRIALYNYLLNYDFGP